MKGIKLGIVAVCIALAGICIATNNVIAYLAGVLSVIIAIVAYADNDEKK